MHIAVACGGTGGHMLPGLEVAGELRRRGHDVVLWVSGKAIESETLKRWDGGLVKVRAVGFPFGLSLRWFGVVAVLVRAIWHARKKMRSDRPDAILAMGSYSSVGPVVAARTLGGP
ncbi:MAG: glycosyltransferase, partial [Verrucomicrobia bacterium]|nr:glycosyltransferase [Verrucomicrobiota bacterium]